MERLDGTDSSRQNSKGLWSFRDREGFGAEQELPSGGLGQWRGEKAKELARKEKRNREIGLRLKAPCSAKQA